MRELVGTDYTEPVFEDGVMIGQESVLIYLGEVRKSGARIYFRPANNDFTSNGKDFFETYRAAYKSENW